MKKKMLILQVLLGLLAAQFLIQPAWALHLQTFGNIDESASEHEPSGSPVKIRIACYNVFTRDFLDCPFTLALLEREDNGGHVGHAGPHPLVDPNKAAFETDVLDLDPNPLRVESKTDRSRVLIEYPVSEAAGEVDIEVIVESPPGFFCVFKCFTERGSKAVHTVRVGIRGLLDMTSRPKKNSGALAVGFLGIRSPFTCKEPRQAASTLLP